MRVVAASNCSYVMLADLPEDDPLRTTPLHLIGGDPDTGVEWCWTCKTCGCVDINRDPPSDPDADAYERNL